MKTPKKYISPEITKVKLDNEISLILLSDAPEGPGEGQVRNSIEYFNQNHLMA